MSPNFSVLILILALFFQQVERTESVSCINPDKNYLERLLKHGTLRETPKEAPEEKQYNNFTCPYIEPSETIPTSVNKLRPGDIKIIAALGDSLSAGNGAAASTILGVINNYRGLAFSVGGGYHEPLSFNYNDNVEEHFSLPNAFKFYNPDIKGWAEGVEEQGEPGANLDMAIMGSKAINMTQQAHRLIMELKANPVYDFENDWKVLTLFIGGNNLCQFCLDDRSTPDVFAADVQAALDFLQENVPRMFVNLVTIFNINQVAALGQDKLTCQWAHNCFCYCALLEDSYSKLTLQRYNGLYRGRLHNLVQSGRYNTKEDFTVVIQPFLENTSPPFTDDQEPDLSYFAPDCFHFSQKGHNYAGMALWNNMFQRLGTKNQVWKLGEELDCPSEENPYIWTYQNSMLSKN